MKKEYEKFEYNENGDRICTKDSTGLEKWFKYDENNNLVYYKNSK